MPMILSCSTRSGTEQMLKGRAAGLSLIPLHLQPSAFTLETTAPILSLMATKNSLCLHLLRGHPAGHAGRLLFILSSTICLFQTHPNPQVPKAHLGFDKLMFYDAMFNLLTHWWQNLLYTNRIGVSDQRSLFLPVYFPELWGAGSMYKKKVMTRRSTQIYVF